MSRFLVLMENFDTAVSATATALDSSGSAMQENERYLDSYEAKLNKAKNAWTETALAMEESFLGDAIEVFTHSGTGLIKMLTSLVKHIGLLPVVLGIAGAALGSFTNRLKALSATNLGATFLSHRKSFEGLGIAANVMAGGMTAGTIAARGLNTALMTLARSLPPLLIFSAIGFGISKVTGYFVENRQRAEELEAQYEKMMEANREAVTTNSDVVNELIDSYKRMSEIRPTGGFEDVETEQRYLDIQQELAELFPSLIRFVDEKGQAHLTAAENIDKEVEAMERLTQAEYEQRIKKIEEGFKDQQKAVEEARKNLKSYEQELVNLQSGDRNLEENIGGFSKDELEGLERLERKLVELLWLREELEKAGDVKAVADADFQILNVREEIKEQEEDIRKQISNITFEQARLNNAIREITDDAIQQFQYLSGTLGNEIVPEITNQISRIISDIDFEGMSRTDISTITREFATLGKELSDAFNEEDVNTFHELTSEIDEFARSLEPLDSSIDRFGMSYQNMVDAMETSDELKKLANELEGVEETGLDAAEVIEEIDDLYSKHIGRITELNGFLNELNEEQGLSAKSLGLIADEYGQLLPLLDDEIRLRKAIEEATKQEAEVAKQAVIEKIQHNTDLFNIVLKGNDSFFNELASKYKVDLDNFKSLAMAKQEVTKAIINTMAKGWSSFFRVTGDGMTALSQEAVRMATTDQGHVNVQLMKYAYQTSRNMNREISAVVNHLDNISMGSVDLWSSNFSSEGLKTSKPSSSSSKKASDAAKKEAEAQRRVLEVIQLQIDAYRRKADALDAAIAHEEYYLAKYESTSQQYRQRQQNIASLRKQQADYHKQSISYLEGQLKNNKRLNKEQRIELERTLVSTQQTYYSTLRAIDSINKDIKKSYEDVADEYIQIYKDAQTQMRDIAIKANQDELDALEKNYKRKIDMLDEELSKYEELIQAKLDLIDEEKSEEDFQKELAKKQEERTGYLRQIDILSMDDSIEARGRVNELRELLSEKELEIEEFVADRERDLRKESLRQQLEDKREQIEAEKEMEDEKFEGMKLQFEQEREEIEKHYENILNDERAFAKMREDVLNGNIKNMTKTLKDFSKNIRDNMSTIGTSISNNLLDRISEAQKKLNDVTKSYNAMKTATPGSSGGSTSSSKSSSSTSASKSSGGSKKPTVGKKVKVNKANAKAYMDSYGSQVRPWADQAKAAGVSYGQGLYLVNTRGGYGALGKTNSINSALAWVKLEDLVGLNTGGMTKNFRGGRIAELHGNEIVHNPVDTGNLLEATKILSHLAPNLPRLRGVTNDNSKKSSVVNINIENVHGATREVAQDFAKDIISELQVQGVNLR